MQNRSYKYRVFYIAEIFSKNLIVTIDITTKVLYTLIVTKIVTSKKQYLRRKLI